MNICQLLSPKSTECCDQMTSKKKVLEKISHMMADSMGCNEKYIYDSLLCREKLGTTGLGGGVAIPHASVSHCTHATAVFLLLNHPIDYDSPDKKPVDIIFAIIVPKDANNPHLEYLSQIAKLLSDKKIISQLRHAHSNEALYHIFERSAEKFAA
jgi:PTS system nitrogen regulatory IIA component